MENKKRYLLIVGLMVLCLCTHNGIKESSDERIKQLSEEEIMLLVNPPKKETVAPVYLSYEKLLKHLGEQEYLTQDDIAYASFLKLFDCNASDSIINHSDNPKLKLYAYYQLVSGECSFSTGDAIRAIQSFKVNHDDTLIGVWILPTVREELYLHQVAADRIWGRYDFRMTKQQKKLVGKLRAF